MYLFVAQSVPETTLKSIGYLRLVKIACYYLVMKYGVFALGLLLPLGFVFADTTGFANESVWTSRSNITEGQTVLIHAALTNNDTDTLTGTLHFKDGDTKVGDIAVSLKTGEARIFSVSWTPKTSGKHSISAEIESDQVQLSENTARTTVTVAALPAKTGLEQKASVESSTFTDSRPMQEKIGNISPAVSNTITPALNTIDSWRKSGSDYLAEKAANQEGVVKGIHTQIEGLNKKGTPEAKTEARKKTAYQIFATLLLYVYNILLTVLSKAGYFYPIFFFLFFFILYKIYRRMTRPAHPAY